MVDSSGDVILVADTNNHCIKRVDLVAGSVETVRARSVDVKINNISARIRLSLTVRVWYYTF